MFGFDKIKLFSREGRVGATSTLTFFTWQFFLHGEHYNMERLGNPDSSSRYSLYMVDRKKYPGLHKILADARPSASPEEREEIARLVQEGYTSGIDPHWRLDADDMEDDLARQEIARLIREGYTSGYEPRWSLYGG
jgi:hypothetical protein